MEQIMSHYTANLSQSQNNKWPQWLDKMNLNAPFGHLMGNSLLFYCLIRVRHKAFFSRSVVPVVRLRLLPTFCRKPDHLL